MFLESIEILNGLSKEFNEFQRIFLVFAIQLRVTYLQAQGELRKKTGTAESCKQLSIYEVLTMFWTLFDWIWIELLFSHKWNLRVPTCWHPLIISSGLIDPSLPRVLKSFPFSKAILYQTSWKSAKSCYHMNSIREEAGVELSSWNDSGRMVVRAISEIPPALPYHPIWVNCGGCLCVGGGEGSGTNNFSLRQLPKFSSHLKITGISSWRI